jgi:hypothetical protein
MNEERTGLRQTEHTMYYYFTNFEINKNQQ